MLTSDGNTDAVPGTLLTRTTGGDLRIVNLASLRVQPGKKLTFMGGDIAQWQEWNYDGDLQWDLLQWESHQGVQRLMGDLNRLYTSEPALHQQDFEHTGFEWVDCHNHNDSVLVYLRRGANSSDFVLVACNFTPVVRQHYRIGVPEGGWYAEILNTDSQFYGGSNVGNYPGLTAEKSE
ncbi:MAG: 1,4-alpha-glucan branching enzyme, partial [Myxococcales bacterium]|nr:1,4-alpha-glucan branching enzyme [Myxococcales bacterium]